VSGNLAKLNRVLLVALCKNAETANTIADRIEELERENAALREAGHLAEKIIVQRTDEIRHLERENAALREDNLKAHQMACAAGLERDRLRDELAALWEAALALINEIDEEALYRVGPPKGEILYEHVGPLRAALDAARIKEGGAL
jgi:hypothetical protein